MINPVTGWFEVVWYDDQITINIANLVETTWLSRYPRPIEITYDQGKEFIGHEFIKSLMETEYRITAKPITLGISMSNAILERIHQVLGNTVSTFNVQKNYFDKNDPWRGILAAAAISIRSTTSGQKGYSPVQLIFFCDMILLIKHRVDWELICQRK